MSAVTERLDGIDAYTAACREPFCDDVRALTAALRDIDACAQEWDQRSNDPARGEAERVWYGKAAAKIRRSLDRIMDAAVIDAVNDQFEADLDAAIHTDTGSEQ